MCNADSDADKIKKRHSKKETSFPSSITQWISTLDYPKRSLYFKLRTYNLSSISVLSKSSPDILYGPQSWLKWNQTLYAIISGLSLMIMIRAQIHGAFLPDLRTSSRFFWNRHSVKAEALLSKRGFDSPKNADTAQNRSDNKTKHSVISFCSPHFANTRDRRKDVRLLPPFFVLVLLSE